MAKMPVCRAFSIFRVTSFVTLNKSFNPRATHSGVLCIGLHTE